MLVFIDESGDQGFGKKSTPYMVFAMVVFKNGTDAKATDDAITALRIRKKEFKFRASTSNVKDAFFNVISLRKFDIRAVVIEKNKFLEVSEKLGSDFPKSKQIYFYGLCELLDSYPLKGAKVKLDKRADESLKFFMEMQKNMINEKKKGTIEEYGMKDSESDNLIQLADMVVGAIARSYDPSKPNHDQWYQKLKLKKNEIVEII